MTEYALERTEGGDDLVLLEEAPIAPASWLQLIALVADGSTSMTWKLKEPDESMSVVARRKADGVAMATRDVLNRLEAGRMASNFWVTYVAVSDRLMDQRPPVPLLDIPSSESFDPTSKGTGGTRIEIGMNAAADEIETFYNQHASRIPVSAVVLVESDGEDSNPDGVQTAAKRLKEMPNTYVAACLFSTKGQDDPRGAGLLQSIVSGPHLYQTVYSAEQLRKFFYDSVTQVTQAAQGLQAGGR